MAEVAAKAASAGVHPAASASAEAGSYRTEARPPASREVRAASATTAPAPFAPVAPPGATQTGLVYNSVMLRHKHPAEDHPEAPRRIAHIFHLLKTSGYLARMERVRSREATRQEIRRVHTEEVVSGVYNSAFLPFETLKANGALLERKSSLYLNEYSALCARFSAGSLIEMCEAVVSGRIRNGFAVIRPPGHHAEPNRSMGFCLFNNVAIATRAMQVKHTTGDKAVKRVMVVDWYVHVCVCLCSYWLGYAAIRFGRTTRVHPVADRSCRDVHHGNGTQAVFNSDDSVLYVSLHRYEDGHFYPGGPFGSMASVGTGPGRGFSVNVPWPTVGMNDGDYLHAFDSVILPIAAEYAPDLVVISAGFDAAQGDPLGMNLVSPTGYAHMTSRLAQLAGGRLVVALEGGYNVDAIAPSALAVTRVLLGEAPPPLPQGTVASESARRTCEKVRNVHARFWANLADPDADPCDPLDDDEEDDAPMPSPASDDDASSSDGEDRPRRTKRRRVQPGPTASFPQWMRDDAATARVGHAELLRIWREHVMWQHFGLTVLAFPARPIYATPSDPLPPTQDSQDDVADEMPLPLSQTSASTDGGDASSPDAREQQDSREPSTYWPVPAGEHSDAHVASGLVPAPPLVHAMVSWDICTAGRGMPTDPCGSGVGHTHAATPAGDTGYRAVMLYVHDAGAYHASRDGREGGTPLAHTGYSFSGSVPGIRESSPHDDAEVAAYRASNYVAPDSAAEPPSEGGGYMALLAWAKAHRIAVVDVCALVAPALATPSPQHAYATPYTGLGKDAHAALSRQAGPVAASVQDAITLAAIAAYDAAGAGLPARVPWVFVGAGSAGTNAVMGLLAARGADRAKAVVQFAGMGALPATPPEQESLRAFYASSAHVVVPHSHSYYTEHKQRTGPNRLGRVHRAEQHHPLRMVGCELATAMRFVEDRLAS